MGIHPSPLGMLECGSAFPPQVPQDGVSWLQASKALLCALTVRTGVILLISLGLLTHLRTGGSGNSAQHEAGASPPWLGMTLHSFSISVFPAINGSNKTQFPQCFCANLCGGRALQSTPVPGVTHLPWESPACPWSHPCSPGVTPLPRDRLCPSLSQESCCAGCTSQQELGPRALQSCLPGFQGTSPGMLWEVFPRPGLRLDAIVIFISKQETGSLPGQAGVGRNCCHKLP